jgi:hypothetical protein
MTSLVRDHAVDIIGIANGESISEEFDARLIASASVGVDNTMDGTHLAVYGSPISGEPKRPLYDSDNALLIVTASDGTIVLPEKIFPVGYLALVSCSDANGTLQVEGADRTFVITATT